jgi:propionyl-CoA synthetase
MAATNGRAAPSSAQPLWRQTMSRYPAFYRRSIAERDDFWREQAQRIEWQTPFEQVCDNSRPPFTCCFVGG